MKKKLLLLFLMFFAILFTGCEKKEKTDALDKIYQRGKIVVGVKYDTKPFGYIDSHQKLVGFDVDLAHEIAKSLLGDENKVEFKQVTPSNRILALNSGQIDMIIATMTITPQRKQIVDFSSPYFIAGQAILVPQKSDIKSLRELNKKRVIIVFGSTAERNLRLMAPEAIVMGYKTYTSGYDALKQGRADAMTSDDTILLGFAMQDKSLKLLPARYSKEPYAAAFKKGKSSDRLRTKVDFIIKGLAASGELKHLKAKWIKY